MKKIISAKSSNNNLIFWLITFVIVIITSEFGLRIIDHLFISDGDYNYYYMNINKMWGKEYYRELREVWANKIFVPFVQWGSSEYHGKYININSQGIRITWNPVNINKRIPDKLYMFGGSTVWGEGARDNNTIPSILSKVFNNNDDNYIHVYNYGEDSYTFPQEMIRLILLLKNGYKPQYVIFYDGDNDVYAAYQSGVPASIQNVDLIKHKLEVKTFRLTFIELMHHSKLIKALGILKSKLLSCYNPGADKFPEIASSYDDGQLKSLAQGIVEQYLLWKNLLDSLAKVYNFKYLCFWQPVIFTEEKIFPEDARGDPRLTDESLAKLYKYTNILLKEQSISNFWNISDVLDKRQEFCYIDLFHITEGGNAIVARKICEIFEKNK